MKRLPIFAACILALAAFAGIPSAGNNASTIASDRYHQNNDSIPTDTVKTDTLKSVSQAADSLATDTLKGKKDKKKEESEYEKLLKKGGSVQDGLFRVRHIEDKYYFEVPDSMIGRYVLCVTRFTAVPQGLGQFAGEEVNHCTVYF